jgi:hypothetical protein
MLHGDTCLDCDSRCDLSYSSCLPECGSIPNGTSEVPLSFVRAEIRANHASLAEVTSEKAHMHLYLIDNEVF